MKTQIVTILLGVLAAMYLSIGGGGRHLTSADAAAFTPRSPIVRAMRAPLWSSPDADSPASDSHDRARNASDSRDCRLSLLLDSDCLFD